MTISAELASRLRGSAPVLVLTGAGVSAESGLATFRGPDGLWRGRDPMALATPEAFRADPLEVWRFYDWRRQAAAAAEPNAAHRALAAWDALRPEFALVTQNVDGLHERAGSARVLRLHGSLWRVRCTGGCSERECPATPPFAELPPRCACGALLRPGVVWFGEPLPVDALSAAETQAGRAAVVLVVGTSSRVWPAAGIAHRARRAGAWVVEVNPEHTELTAHADEHLAGPAGNVVPELARAAGVPLTTGAA